MVLVAVCGEMLMSFDRSKKTLLYYFNIAFERGGKLLTEEMQSEIKGIVEEIESEFLTLKERMEHIESKLNLPE
jgi:hypothetical protein